MALPTQPSSVMANYNGSNPSAPYFKEFFVFSWLNEQFNQLIVDEPDGTREKGTFIGMYENLQRCYWYVFLSLTHYVSKNLL